MNMLTVSGPQMRMALEEDQHTKAPVEIAIREIECGSDTCKGRMTPSKEVEFRVNGLKYRVF